MKEHYDRLPKCVNPCIGFRNIVAFYLDFDKVESEFRKEFVKEEDNMFNVSEIE